METLNGYIIINIDEKKGEETTSSGIIIPKAVDSEEDETFVTEGEVLFCGREEKRLGVGDKVLVSAFSPIDLFYKGKKAWAVKADEVIAKL